MKILNQRQIRQMIERLAIQILENNFESDEIILAGINNNGMGFARMLYERLEAHTSIPLTLTNIRLNPADPLAAAVEMDISPDSLRGKAIVIIDDVANTGRTIFYAFKPFMAILPAKIEVAVLVDRKHKSFPVKVDYVGLSLATTLRESIDVQIRNVEEEAVYLV
ncbi:MAG: phosphoribosyltransferase [Saprospiraceae bacterium]|nr:phosphoribosyltransferase [Saprospiraceae bacterium]